jgi:hypothetical protein
MYNEKYLLFSTGGGSADPLNLDRHEMAVYCAKDFKSMKPSSARSLDLFFVTEKGQEIVTLKIKNGLHSKVMQAISNAIVMGNQSIIPIADVDNNIFINTNIYDVIIKSKDTYVQTLTDNSRTQLTVPRSNYKKCIVANIDGADTVRLTLELHDGSSYTKLVSGMGIPVNTTLIFEENEIDFDATTYTLHATSGDADGQLTFTFNY